MFPICVIPIIVNINIFLADSLTATEAKEAFKNGGDYAVGDDYRIIVSKDLNAYAVYYIPSGHIYYCTESCRGEYVIVDDMEIIEPTNSKEDIFGDEEHLAKA